MTRKPTSVATSGRSNKLKGIFSDISVNLESEKGEDETSETYSKEETERRRDEVIKRMIDTPPQPHKPLGKQKSKATASQKKRGIS